MSNPFTELVNFFTGRAPAAPKDLDMEFESADGGAEDEGSEAVEKPDPILAGEVLGIEYTSTGGAVQRRWMSVEGFKQRPDGAWAVCGYSFTRRRAWSMPIERITKVHNREGESFSSKEAFGVNAQGVPGAKEKENERFEAILDLCGDGVRTLTALARIDGELHPKELGVILDYAQKACSRNNLELEDKDRFLVERFVKSQQPTGGVVEGCLKRLSTSDSEAQIDFFWHAREVMDADGLQDPAEVEMFLKISDGLSHAI